MDYKQITHYGKKQFRINYFLFFVAVLITSGSIRVQAQETELISLKLKVPAWLNTALGDANQLEGGLHVFQDWDVYHSDLKTSRAKIGMLMVILDATGDGSEPSKLYQLKTWDTSSAILLQNEWEEFTAGNDNLGNHTATANIQLSDMYLSNNGDSIEGISMDDYANTTLSFGTTAGQLILKPRNATSGANTSIVFNENANNPDYGMEIEYRGANDNTTYENSLNIWGYEGSTTLNIRLKIPRKPDEPVEIGKLKIGSNTYPTAAGADGQVLATNGSGTLSWAWASGLSNGVPNQTLRYGTSGWEASSVLEIDGSNVITSGNLFVGGDTISLGNGASIGNKADGHLELSADKTNITGDLYVSGGDISTARIDLRGTDNHTLSIRKESLAYDRTITFPDASGDVVLATGASLDSTMTLTTRLKTDNEIGIALNLKALPRKAQYNLTAGTGVALGFAIPASEKFNTEPMDSLSVGDVNQGALIHTAMIAARKNTDKDSDLDTDLAFYTRKDGNLASQMVIGTGVGIGTDETFGYALAVNGTLGVKGGIEIENVSDWPDYVFEEGYELRELAEVEQFIARHGHLPGVPSQSEVDVGGINVGKMDARLLEKIEELTLYVLDMNKRINAIEKENNKLKRKLKKIQRIKIE